MEEGACAKQLWAALQFNQSTHFNVAQKLLAFTTFSPLRKSSMSFRHQVSHREIWSCIPSQSQI